MNMSVVELQKHLKQLRLHGMNSSLETRLLEASQGTSATEVLASLVQDELDFRRSRQLQTRLKSSGLPERPTLTDFDWNYNPKLPKKMIFELATTKFIRDGEDALLIGNPGTGKSHVAKVIALAAITQGYKAIYRDAKRLFEDLFEGRQLKKEKKLQKLFWESDLLVIDDLFLRRGLPESGTDDFLDIILNRYNLRRSTVITSNRPIEDWGKLLKDNAASSAILDRLLHRGNLLKFEGRSFRLKAASKRMTNQEAKQISNDN